MTAGRVTPGDWKAGKDLDGFFTADGPPHWNLLLKPAEERAANIALAVAAVNACKHLNPTDPLAAAQHLEALVKAAWELWDDHAAVERDWTPFQQILYGKLHTALVQITGKP